MNEINVSLITPDKETPVNSSPLEEIIGQSEVKKKLSFFLKSHSEETPFPTVLLTGSQGLGKTYTSEKIARSLGRKFVECNCGKIKKSEDFVNDILMKQVSGNKGVTLLLDESHNLSTEITTFLLTLLNPNEEKKTYFKIDNWNVELDMRHFNVIFATTDAHMMFRPLVNRCTEIYFRPYRNDEVIDILKVYLNDISIAAPQIAHLSESLADACRRRARDAFMLSQNIIRYCRMNNVHVLDEAGWAELRNVFDIHARGLKLEEVRLLKALNENSPISVKNIAILLGVNQKNVEDELEVWPRELGFVESGSRGHFITDEGKEYLKEIAK